MKQKIHERICFDDLARNIGISRTHFLRLLDGPPRLTPGAELVSSPQKNQFMAATA